MEGTAAATLDGMRDDGFTEGEEDWPLVTDGPFTESKEYAIWPIRGDGGRTGEVSRPRRPVAGPAAST